MKSSIYLAGLIIGIILTAISPIFLYLMIFNFATFFLFLIFIIVGINLIRVNFPKYSRSSRRENLSSKSGALSACNMTHVSGLPLGQSSHCTVYVFDQQLCIVSGNAIFYIDYDQITGTQFTSERDDAATLMGYAYHKNKNYNYFLVIQYINSSRNNAEITLDCTSTYENNEIGSFRKALFSKVSNSGAQPTSTHL